jgi:hypothetical protein
MIGSSHEEVNQQAGIIELAVVVNNTSSQPIGLNGWQ